MMDDTKLSIVVHPHPIVELRIQNVKNDGCGYIGDCIMYNVETSTIESSFNITEEIAKDVIQLMQLFIDTYTE